MIAIGIDSGTQSTRAIALDVETGTVLFSAQRSYGLIANLPHGHMEQHPEDWFAATHETVAQCISNLGNRKSEIRCIGVSGQQHGLVVLDEKGNSVRPAKLWCDTSTVAECHQLHQAVGSRERMIELIGNPMLPGYTAPKILWLKKNEPHHFAMVRSILLPHDYLNYRLTGEMRMEYGDASGTALMDVRQRTWSQTVLKAIDGELEGKLPRLQSSLLPVGLLRDSLMKEWGLSGAVLVSSGGGDNMMGAIGTGNLRPGVFTASLGTSGTVYAFSNEAIVDPRGDVAAFCDSTDNWLPLVCTMNVTVATEAVRQLFGMDHAALEKSVMQTPAGAGGVLFLPYLNGERTPDLPGGTGVFHGLTTRNMNPSNIVRAVMEGVTMGLGYGVKRFSDLGVAPSEIRLTGGGSKSWIWRQIAADVFGAPTVCLSTSEGAALGAAIQAAATESTTNRRGDSLTTIAERCVKLDESSRCLPNQDTVDLYKELQARQTTLTTKLQQTGFL